MTDLRLCTKGVGFAVVASLACSVALTTTALGEGGETPTNGFPPPTGAVPIPALPYWDTGSTCDNFDDFDVTCPFSGSTSPDVFYSLVLEAEAVVTITLCESGYDTKLYVLDSALFAIACNDDICSDSAGNGFRSSIAGLALSAGAKYYIGIDGWSGSCGFYEFHIEDFVEPEPCEVICDPTKTPEGEPCGFGGGGIDVTNGGCNSSPPVFSPISCGEEYCGTGYFDGSFRDTDWYEMFCPDETEIVWKGVSEFPVVFGLVDTGFIPDCALATALSPFAVCAPCDPCVVAPVTCPAGGTAWWFVGHDFTVITDCFLETAVYNATANCAAPPCTPCPGDIDGSCVVGFSDLNTVLANWGDCP